MRDDLKKRGPPDAIPTNVNEAWELGGWSKLRCVTELGLAGGGLPD